MIMDLQFFSHHKGGGSTANGRNSAGRRLGTKAADGSMVTAGSIIYRQRGTHINPGENWAVVVTILCTLRLPVLLSLNAWAVTSARYLSTQLLNKLNDQGGWELTQPLSCFKVNSGTMWQPGK